MKNRQKRSKGGHSCYISPSLFHYFFDVEVQLTCEFLTNSTRNILVSVRWARDLQIGSRERVHGFLDWN